MPQIDASKKDSIKPDDMITLHYRPEPTGKLMEVLCRIISISGEGTKTGEGTQPSEGIEPSRGATMELCWRGEPKGVPTWLLFGEKVHRITVKQERECFLEVWETQSGPLAWLVKWMMGEKLIRMSEGIAEGLKGFVESSEGKTV